MRLNPKKPNDRVAVALVLCFCVVAIASIFTMKSNFDQLDLDDDDNINIAQDENILDQGGQDVVKPVPTIDSTAQKPAPEATPGTNEKKATSFTVPVEGKIVKEFSKDVPIYSPTLDQFVVHTGVDIEAPTDTPVLAAGEGTITKVYNDDRLGITVEISHGGGIVTRYSNLSTTKMIGEGDVVKKGQPISGVGSSSLFESLETPHLHFEVIKDGVPIDPSSYIK